MSTLQGKTALVTGSVDGIGYAALHALAAQGCAVMMHGLGDPAIIESRRAALAEETGATVHAHSADLSTVAAAEALFRDTEAAVGPVDILVNNAVTRHFHAIEDLPFESWTRALAVNLSAPFRLIQLALPGMKARRWGRIVNIASVWGLTGTVNRVDYVATKHALIGVTKATALEAAPFGVTCNAICPGSTLTPDARSRLEARMAETGQSWDEAAAALLANRGTSGRFVQPGEIGSLVAYLCSPGAAAMTGTPVVMDNGWNAM